MSMTDDDDCDFDIMALMTTINHSEDDSCLMLAAAAAAAAASSSSCREQLQGAVVDFFSHVVPHFSSDTFKSHFRMNRTTFEVSKVYSFYRGLYQDVLICRSIEIRQQFRHVPKPAYIKQSVRAHG